MVSARGVPASTTLAPGTFLRRLLPATPRSSARPPCASALRPGAGPGVIGPSVCDVCHACLVCPAESSERRSLGLLPHRSLQSSPHSRGHYLMP